MTEGIPTQKLSGYAFLLLFLLTLGILSSIIASGSEMLTISGSEMGGKIDVTLDLCNMFGSVMEKLPQGL
ncbi:hypothetical protein V6N11_045332 [Hibiscus sabdariffa]|uniref:Uncharacterized protein n=1 Tax=Hibiscus sabdariffa TaxID=183260 RepID=A0ABR2Q0S8_9ROSI